MAESRAIAVCAAIGERGRCFVTDEDTEYRKRTASNAAAPPARRTPGTATGHRHHILMYEQAVCLLIFHALKRPNDQQICAETIKAREDAASKEINTVTRTNRLYNMVLEEFKLYQQESS